MEWVSGNIFIRPHPPMKIGDVVTGHKHNFDHTTIVFTGAVRVKVTWLNGQELTQDFHAPSHFLVAAGCEHEITALEDDTIFWCVYSHRNSQGEVVEKNIGWNQAYG